MQAPDLLILILATWYAAYSVANKGGPWNVFGWLRQHVPLGGLTTCIVCLSFWFGVAFYLLSITVLAPVVYPFAAAGGAILLYRYTGGSRVE
jgi:hypothetical protein